MRRLRLHVIACPVFQRELELLARRAKTEPVLRHLDMGLHEGSAEGLRTALQAAIDGVDADQTDAVAIAYGLCNRGVVGLRARGLPVVIPRAHDCIGMLLGSARCYLAQLAKKYGEDNADYLLEQFKNFTRHYERLAYIATPVPEAERWEAAAREIADRHGWEFERLTGDLGWLQRLLDADWTEQEFLVLKPGERVGLRSDAGLIGAEPA